MTYIISTTNRYVYQAPVTTRLHLPDWRTVYKLTDQKDQTYGGCQWGVGVENPKGVRGGAFGLCGGGFYHAYHTAELALLLNPLGAHFPANTLHLWRAEIRGVVEEDGGILKLGATECRTMERMELGVPTTVQRVAFAALLARAALDILSRSIPAWGAWADGWLDGVDRTAHAAQAAHADASAARAAHAAHADASAARAASAADIRAAIADAAILALIQPWE